MSKFFIRNKNKSRKKVRIVVLLAVAYTSAALLQPALRNGNISAAPKGKGGKFGRKKKDVEDLDEEILSDEYEDDDEREVISDSEAGPAKKKAKIAEEEASASEDDYETPQE